MNLLRKIEQPIYSILAGTLLFTAGFYAGYESGKEQGRELGKIGQMESIRKSLQTADLDRPLGDYLKECEKEHNIKLIPEGMSPRNAYAQTSRNYEH